VCAAPPPVKQVSHSWHNLPRSASVLAASASTGSIETDLKEAQV
jgi:hypothetical protein